MYVCMYLSIYLSIYPNASLFIEVLTHFPITIRDTINYDAY